MTHNIIYVIIVRLNWTESTDIFTSKGRRRLLCSRLPETPRQRESLKARPPAVAGGDSRDSLALRRRHDGLLVWFGVSW